MYIPWRHANRILTVGIDIDGNTIKLVALKKRCAVTNSFELISYAHVTTSLEFPSINAAVCNALQQAGINKKSKIVIALPYGQVLTQTLGMKAVDDLVELENNIIAYCEQIISYPLHEACIDFEIIKDHKTNSDEHDVRVVIARRNAVEEKINLFAASDFSVAAVDVESDALARCICYVLSRDTEDCKQQITVAIHIAAQKILGIVLYQEKIIFTQEVVVYVTDPAGIKSEHYLEKIKILFPILDMAAHNFLKTEKTSVFVAEKVYLSGCKINNDEFISQIKNIIHKQPCLLNPFSSMEKKQEISTKHIEKYAQSLVISCGLAMRDFHDGC